MKLCELTANKKWNFSTHLKFFASGKDFSNFGSVFFG